MLPNRPALSEDRIEHISPTAYRELSVRWEALPPATAVKQLGSVLAVLRKFRNSIQP